MNERVGERFALARRGLPLPIATHSPLRAVWLPSVVRNRAAPAVDAPAPFETPAAQAAVGGDEPWWMEAAEWVPSEEVKSRTDQGAMTTTPSQHPMDNEPVDRFQADLAHRMHERPVSRAHTAADPQEPMARSAAAMGEHLPAPGTQRSNPGRNPSPSQAQAATGEAELSAVRGHPASPLATAPAFLPTLPSTAKAANRADEPGKNSPASAPAPYASGADSVLQAEKRMSRFQPDLPAVGVVENSVATSGKANAQGPSQAMPEAQDQVATAGGFAAVTAAQPGAGASSVRLNRDSAQPLATRLQTMGIPRAVVEQNALAHANPPRVDMNSFLAPPPRRERQVQIDRISVTVQAPPAPPQAAAHAARPATAPAAPTNFVYRNPWSGYHARRD